MTTAIPLQIDVELWVVTWLTAYLGTGTRVCTELPYGRNADGSDRLLTSCPLVKVKRIGGPNDRVNVDIASVELQSLASVAEGDDGRKALDPARKLAYRAGGALFAARGQVLNGVTVPDVGMFSGPTEVDYGNPAVRRFAATYQVRVKPA